MEPVVIYEDKSIVVVNKPSGMVVNESATTRDLTVQKWFGDKYQIQSSKLQNGDNNYLKSEFYEKGGVVHRLDKDTSGVMVLAKTSGAYEKLKQQFLERKTSKKYVALVHSTFTDKSGEIRKPIERHPRERKKFTIGNDLSRTAITEWRVKREYRFREEDFSLLELEPHTGRTHQLRVHLQYMHHPIVSDPIYGFKKRWQTDLEWCPRLFLQAVGLEVQHPDTGEKVKWEIVLDEELQLVLAKMTPTGEPIF